MWVARKLFGTANGPAMEPILTRLTNPLIDGFLESKGIPTTEAGAVALVEKQAGIPKPIDQLVDGMMENFNGGSITPR